MSLRQVRARRSDANHGAECRGESDHPVRHVRRPRRRVEQHSSGAGDRICDDAIAAPAQRNRSDEQREACDRSENRASLGCDPLALDRVLQEQEACDREHDSAADRSAAHAEPALPLEAFCGCVRGRARRRSSRPRIRCADVGKRLCGGQRAGGFRFIDRRSPFAARRWRGRGRRLDRRLSRCVFRRACRERRRHDRAAGRRGRDDRSREGCDLLRSSPRRLGPARGLS